MPTIHFLRDKRPRHQTGKIIKSNNTMKKFMILTALLLQMAVAGMAQNDGGANHLYAYIDDPTGTATNVREKPNGAIAGKLPKGNYSNGEYYSVELQKSVNGWWQIGKVEDALQKGIAIKSKTGEKWIHYSVLAVHTRNYGREQELTFHNEPSPTSDIVFKFCGSIQVRPVDFDREKDWVLVETYDKYHRGWVQAEWLCCLPLTTCP